MINLKKDLEKYLIKNFKPLNDYISFIEQNIKEKINEEVDNKGAIFEYLDINNKKIVIYINTINSTDKYISFYMYNEFHEVIEMLDFLLYSNRNISVVRYSAIFYENDIAKIVNSGYTYENNNIIKGWKNKYIIKKEIGHHLATCDNLANLGCHIENENIDTIELSKNNQIKKLELHF